MFSNENWASYLLWNYLLCMCCESDLDNKTFKAYNLSIPPHTIVYIYLLFTQANLIFNIKQIERISKSNFIYKGLVFRRNKLLFVKKKKPNWIHEKHALTLRSYRCSFVTTYLIRLEDTFFKKLIGIRIWNIWLKSFHVLWRVHTWLHKKKKKRKKANIHLQSVIWMIFVHWIIQSFVTMLTASIPIILKYTIPQI